MDCTISTKNPTQLSTDCLVVILSKNDKTLPAQFPEALRRQVSQLIKQGDFKGANDSLVIHEPADIKAKRLMLVGSGSSFPLSTMAWLRCINRAATAASATASKKAALHLDSNQFDGEPTEQVYLAARTLADANYRFQQYRSKASAEPALKNWTLSTAERSSALNKAAKQGLAVAQGMALSKDLGNQPPNVCHPDYLHDLAKSLVASYDKLKLTVITEKQAEKMGMGAFCSVARGSARDGKLIALEYKGGTGKPLALVGKGITFDTGGISLKPGAGMDEMKYDMCGAAGVLGTLKAVCEMDLKINLVVVVAAAENMPDGTASRPGDIVKTLSGQTVEILNTDAEGRLVLCDALTWTQKKFKPHTIVDVATLTGACVVALGSQAQAVYANDDTLCTALLDAGQITGDRGWPMPLWDEYQEQLNSPFADMANIGGPKAGSVTAACFLARFTKEVKWAHLDIAGTAWVSGGMKKGGTGRPVPMLTEFVVSQTGKRK